MTRKLKIFEALHPLFFFIQLSVMNLSLKSWDSSVLNNPCGGTENKMAATAIGTYNQSSDIYNIQFSFLNYNQ